MIYNVDKLISLFKIGANIPDGSKVLSDDQIIDILNAELISNLVPLVMRLKESYFVTNKDITFSGNQYRIPPRCIGGKIKDLYFQTGDGKRLPLTLIESTEVQKFNTNYTPSFPTCFYIEGNYINLFPLTSGSGTLKLSYHLRPSRLAKPYRVITGINTGTNVVTFSSFGGASLSAPIGKLDFINAESGNEILYQDITVSATANPSEFSLADSASYTNLKVGDYVCEAQTSVVPQMPEEFHPLLVEYAIINFLQGQPDSEHLKVRLEKRKTLEDNVNAVYKDRVSGQALKIRVNPGRWR